MDTHHFSSGPAGGAAGETAAVAMEAPLEPPQPPPAAPDSEEEDGEACDMEEFEEAGLDDPVRCRHPSDTWQRPRPLALARRRERSVCFVRAQLISIR